MPLLCVRLFFCKMIYPSVSFTVAFSKCCLKYFLPSIFQVDSWLLIFFAGLIAVVQSFHCTEQRGQRLGRRGDPCWESAVQILALLLISCVTPGRVGLPGSLFLHRENKRLGKINTGPDPVIRKVALCAHVVHGSTLGLFLPCSGKPRINSGVVCACVGCYTEGFGSIGAHEADVSAKELSVPSAFASAASCLPSSSCLSLAC